MEPTTEVILVQSFMFPNIWSLHGEGDGAEDRMFRDPLFQNGAMAAENAVLYAREHGWRIIEVQYDDKRQQPYEWRGKTLDSSADVIAGIEYRSGQPVIDRLCEWFALCGNQATTTRTHPILGEVPICDRCNKKIEEL